jgi:hypothetical protein
MFDHRLCVIARLCLVGVICTVAAAGCGSTTKVYEARKTVVYNGQMYNVTDTKQFTTTIDGSLSEGQTVDLKTADKKQVQDLLKKQDGIGVKMAFHFDDKELVYTDTTVKSWSEYDRKRSSFEKAAKQVKDLMQKDNATQVTLK